MECKQKYMLKNYLGQYKISFETTYSRMDQVEFVQDSLKKIVMWYGLRLSSTNFTRSILEYIIPYVGASSWNRQNIFQYFLLESVYVQSIFSLLLFPSEITIEIKLKISSFNKIPITIS